MFVKYSVADVQAVKTEEMPAWVEDTLLGEIKEEEKADETQSDVAAD